LGESGPLLRGRERERRQLLDLARSVVERPDRVLLVAGEAGIGKTHLVRAVVAELADEGFRVAWGRADPVERAVPYAAIGEALSSLPGRASRPWELGGGADAVLQEVYRPVATRLEEQCRDGALIVAIDDLHHADEDTLILLGFLVRRLVDLPIAWLFTVRSHLPEPAPGLEQLVVRLRDDRRLDEIALGPLADDDAARLIEAVAGRSLAPTALAPVLERSAGNPFFATQLALALSESGMLPPAGASDAAIVVPALSQRVALLERVFPLGEGARAVARLASVCGDLDVDQLDGHAEALGLDVAETEVGFDRLVRSGLLRVGTGARYVFVHDLVRETIYADLGPAERRRLHGVAAQSLLDRRMRGEEVDLVELARHLSLGSAGKDARAADALREAGDTLVASSPRSAALRYRQALTYLPVASNGGGELHVRLARALRRAGEPAEVVRVCREGLASAGSGDRDRLTRYLATALADTGDLPAALAIVDAELAARVEQNVVLLTTRALLLRLLDDFAGAAAAIDAAAVEARTVPDRLAVLFQRLNLGLDLGAEAMSSSALAELEGLIPALDPERRIMAHAHAAGRYAGLGEVERGLAHLDQAAALEARGVVDVDWPWSFAARVTLQVYGARWDDAVRTYEQGAPEFGAGLRVLARNHAAMTASDVALFRKDTQRVTAWVGEMVELTPQARRLKLIALSKVDRVEGRLDDAAARLSAPLTTESWPGPMTVMLLISLLHVHVVASSTEPARDLIEALREQARTIGTTYAEVVLALAEARVGDDADAARSGLDRVLACGMRCYEPDFRYDLGRLGVEPERNLLDAHRLFSALGSVDEIARTEAEMRRQDVRVPSRRKADRYALTDAEQKVADLVAEGLTNRAIAERLSYSVKTIEAYLSRVYAKTGCSNRVELARHLASQR
jgi:DNA-binding NarL/FixJ family response regulator